MKASMPNPNTLSPFADPAQWEALKRAVRSLAREEVLSRFEKVSATVKADGSLLTEADTRMQQACCTFLQEHWPAFAFLGEESPTAEQTAALESHEGCWVLDPLDGTSNFASGIPVFTVSLALVIAGRPVLGIVYDPSRDELFAARENMGAELNGSPLTALSSKTKLEQCTAIVDFKRLPASLATALATQAPYSSQRSIGSVALDWCWIAAGRGQLYVHGAQNIWDYAAGFLILSEAGGKSGTGKGDSVFVPRVEKRYATAATTPELFAPWQAYLRSHD